MKRSLSDENIQQCDTLSNTEGKGYADCVLLLNTLPSLRANGRSPGQDIYLPFIEPDKSPLRSHVPTTVSYFGPAESNPPPRTILL